MKEQFATVRWSPADVQTLAPKMSDDEAAEWLARHEGRIQERMVELGWEVIESLLGDLATDDDEPEEDDALLTPTVSAEAYSDDRLVKVSFDATRWFAQADDDEIVALAEIDWWGAEEADYVAEFFEDEEPVSRVFTHVHNLSGSRNACGFECRVDAASALLWISEHRPHLLPDILDAADVGEFDA